MTDITPLIPAGAKIIQGYGPGVIRVNGQAYPSPIIVTIADVRPWGGSYDELLTLAGIDLILVGQGASARPIDGETRAAFQRQKINLEAMDTGAACRTYNVLMAEGRRVAAALLPL